MNDTRVLNLLGAMSVAAADALREGVEGLTGLTGEGPAALVCVGARPGRSIDHLRRSLGLSHSGTVRLVDRLEERGWLRRDASAPGRTVKLELTKAGRRQLRRLLEERRRRLARLLEPLSDAQRDALEEALEVALAGLPADREDAWRICRLCEHSACRGDSCPVGTAVDDLEGGRA